MKPKDPPTPNEPKSDHIRIPTKFISAATRFTAYFVLMWVLLLPFLEQWQHFCAAMILAHFSGQLNKEK